MSIFSERTSTLMHQYGLNQKDLAKMAGVTESAMSYYIKGERTPRCANKDCEGTQYHYRLLTGNHKHICTIQEQGITLFTAQSRKIRSGATKEGRKYTKSRF